MIVVLAGLCVQLGRWQLHRLDERKSRNDITRSNLAAPPAPLAEVVGPQRSVGEQYDWRRAVVTGRYDSSKQVVLRYRNVKDQSGFEIVTPLVQADGTAVLVDRGFLPRRSAATAPGEIPPAPSGEVTVTGRLRRSERGGNTTGGTPVDGTARLINGPQFAPVLGLNLLDGYLIADQQVPPGDPAFVTLPDPAIDGGPHFFYALQWFFFAVLAIGGLVYFTRTDIRGDADDEDEAGPDDEPEPGAPTTETAPRAADAPADPSARPPAELPAEQGSPAARQPADTGSRTD